MGTDGTTDRLDRARRGDTDAFMELFEDARPMVYSVAWRMVGPDDAEDVVMDTYLKAWKAIPGFSGRAASRTWICRIAHNCAVDCLRRRKAWAPVPREGEDPVDPADLPDPAQRSPSEVVAGAETESLVNAALTQLSDEHRTTLLLRFADGLSYSEIAAATAVSIGTVMSRLFNGRRKLVKLLSQESGVRGQESV